MHPLPHQYTITLQYTGAMEGQVTSAGQPTIKFSAPKEFDGPGTGWSPETMLLSSVTSCIALTFQIVAKMMGVAFSELTFAAEGIVNTFDGKRMHFEKITLTPSLKLTDPAQEGKLGKIWENTEKHCIISNSLKTAVHIAPTQLS